MDGDGTAPRLLTAQPGPPAEEAAALDLAHAGEGDGHASQVGRLDDASSLSDETVLRLAEWVYLIVEEVWSGFNLLAEAVARGFETTASTDEGQEIVDAWNRRVGIEDKARMWVKNALVYGRCVMEAGEDFLKVRNPRLTPSSPRPTVAPRAPRWPPCSRRRRRRRRAGGCGRGA